MSPFLSYSITGLDRFGRIVEDAWYNTGTSTYTDDFTYAFDRDSNVLSKTNALDAAFSQSYTYNGLNELTGYTQGNGDSQSYGLDALGNFTSVTTNGTTQTRTNNAQNQLTSVSGATTPTYDPNGNLTTDETGQKYTYDAWNRLVQVTGNGNTVSYSFDALGRRVTETTNGTTQNFYFDGRNVIEQRAAGSNNANLQYVWDPLGTNALVERDRDTNGGGTLDERLYVQQDANANVTALLNTSGSLAERYNYTPFGVITVLSAGWGTLSGTQYAMSPLFQGELHDWTTGDDDFDGRFYRATLQTFTSPDPLGFAAGYSNFYMAMGNNSIDHIDPTGLQNELDFTDPKRVDAIIKEVPKVPPPPLPWWQVGARGGLYTVAFAGAWYDGVLIGEFINAFNDIAAADAKSAQLDATLQSLKANPSPAGSKLPDWLKKRWEEGKQFDAENRKRYPYNEVEVEVNGKPYKLDSYDPDKGEIVSRKFSKNIGGCKPASIIQYLNELRRKYPSGAKVTNSPFNKANIRGQLIQGKQILEVPVQAQPIPKIILDAATQRGITIRDIAGKVYNP